MSTERRVYLENPYDIETIFDALKIARRGDKDMWFLDQLIGTIRLDPLCDTTDVAFRILKKLDLIPAE